MKNPYPARKYVTWSVCLGLILLTAPAHAETVPLRSGKAVSGTIVRASQSNVTLRTQIGVSTYHVNELDPHWVDEHADRLFPHARAAPDVDAEGLVTLISQLTSNDSLATLTPFLTTY
ncbi:MAG: hypothetical protein O3A51_07885, partial [Verrucomicrobia bacterium]|nr:hypothetical protein [Verrucomicrobiota bacterium]